MTIDLMSKVDRLFELRSLQATLKAEEDAIREELINQAMMTGQQVIVGESAIATISRQERKSTDYKALIKSAAVEQQLIDDNTKVSTITVVTCTKKI